MNCRRVPVPFITCANNKLEYRGFRAPYFISCVLTCSTRGALSNGRPYRNRREFITLLGGGLLAGGALLANAAFAQSIGRRAHLDQESASPSISGT
jgi:hypothetical protein